MIRFLPISWQAAWWRWYYGPNIDAIRELRRTARIPLKRAKRLIKKERD